MWGAIRICWHVQNTRRRRNEEEEEEERLGLLVWEWKVALLSLLEKIERKHFFFLKIMLSNLNFWFRNIDVNRKM